MNTGRLANLYRTDGLRGVSRGAVRWGLTSQPAKTARAAVTRVLSSDSVWDREWDVLCILDGCRADLFQEVAGTSGSITSVGSTSRTWVERTLGDRELEDVGYITGNPFWIKANTADLGYLHVEEPTVTDHGIETVPPEPLTERAIATWRRRDDLDRLIVHYMQPHAPFRSRPDWFDSARGTDSWSNWVWHRLRDGEFTHEEVWNAYRDNLEWVLNEGVEPLANNCDATIAISADHGNAMGEWGFWGHPLGCPVDAVRRVPWVVRDGRDTGRIKPQFDDENTTVSDETRKQHLEALGYR